MTSAIDAFLELPVWQHTHRAKLIPLAESARVASLSAGKTLFKQFHPADQFSLLVSGCVGHEVSGEADATAWPMGRVDWPWAALGWSGFLPPHRNGTTARALRDIELLSWQHDTLATLFYADPHLSVSLLRVVLDSVGRQFEAVREERIAARLASTAFGPALVPLPMLTGQPDRHRFAPSVLSALRRSSFFEQFDDATLERLATTAELVRREAGQPLVDQDDDTGGLLVLAAGAAVAWFAARDGARGRLDRFRTVPENGGILAGIPTLSGHYRAESKVIAESTCWFYRIPSTAIEQLIADDPEFGRSFMQRHLVRLAHLLAAARLPKPRPDLEPEVVAVQSLLDHNQARIPVTSTLHKVPHLLASPLTTEVAFNLLDAVLIDGRYEERAIARTCNDHLTGLKAEHRFYRGVLDAYQQVIDAPLGTEAALLRSRCDLTLASAFAHLQTEIVGMAHLPEQTGHIVIMNHLSCPAYYRLPNNYHFSFDTAFVSVLLNAVYGASPIRVVRQSPGAEYGHNLFYSRLGHITVPTAESGLEASDPEYLAEVRRESAEIFFQRGREALSRGENILICPEGRSQQFADSPARFFSGAFRLAQTAEVEPLIVGVALAGFGRRYKDTRLVAVVQPPFRLSEAMRNEGTDNLRTFLDGYRSRFAQAVGYAQRRINASTPSPAPASARP